VPLLALWKVEGVRSEFCRKKKKKKKKQSAARCHVSRDIKGTFRK